MKTPFAILKTENSDSQYRYTYTLRQSVYGEWRTLRTEVSANSNDREIVSSFRNTAFNWWMDQDQLSEVDAKGAAQALDVK